MTEDPLAEVEAHLEQAALLAGEPPARVARAARQMGRAVAESAIKDRRTSRRPEALAATRVALDHCTPAMQRVLVHGLVEALADLAVKYPAHARQVLDRHLTDAPPDPED